MRVCWPQGRSIRDEPVQWTDCRGADASPLRTTNNGRGSRALGRLGAGHNPAYIVRMNLPPGFQSALAALENEPLTGRDKGLPAGKLRMGDIGRQGWNVLRGDVPLPAMVIRWVDVQHNIRLMQNYCDRQGAWLAPHGKTTMAPQIFAAQLAAGAWAMTVANSAQLQVARSFGLDRVMLGNEAIGDYDCRYLAAEMRQHPDFEPYVQVDSRDGLERLARSLEREGVDRPLSVLVELGMPGGRCGVRTVDEAQALASAVLARAGRLRLAGVEGYEGIVHGNTRDEAAAAASEFLDHLAGAARGIRPMAPGGLFLVVAGGSRYFDLAVAHLGRAALPEAQLVLRPGTYVAHDSGHYAEVSPWGQRLGPADPASQLHPALEIWSTVLSRPEPDLAILGMGKRDVPVDLDPPIPLYRSRAEAPAELIGDDCKVFRVQDQHAYLRLPPGADLRVGDLVGSGISHPCTSFDKWRVMLTVDEGRNVTGAIRTFF